MQNVYKILNGKIVAPDRIISGDIIIENGQITEILESKKNISAENEIDAAGAYILPGFIDIHTNGANGFDCTFGVYDSNEKDFVFNEKDYLHGLEKALKFYLSKGSTKNILSTISAPAEQVKQAINFCDVFKNNNSFYNDSLYGIMIEGSFIKDSGFRGAHNPNYFQSPEKEIIEILTDTESSIVKIVNIPPEWGNISFETIEYLKAKNIIVAAGHTSSTADDLKKAVGKGTNLAIHLFNGPSLSSFKPFGNGGAIEEVLKNSSIFAEIIVDGVHVDKAYVLDAIARKGDDRIIAVTDSMFTVGLTEIEEFTISGKVGCVSQDNKFLFVKEKPDALFGSNLSMDNAFNNLFNWFLNDAEGVWNRIHKARSFENALLTASNLCSKNAAQLLGIEKDYGTIEVGKTADLIIGSLKKEEYYKLNIDKVFLKGNLINE